jgi:hypothetical protein
VRRCALAIVVVTGCARIAGIPDYEASDAGLDASVAQQSPYVAAVLADSPMGYFRLDEISSAAAVDVTGGTSGTYVGNVMRGQAGAFPDSGTSVGFDGSDGAVSLENRFDFIGVSAFSLEAWIRPTGFDGDFHEIGSRWHEPSGRAGYTWYQDDDGFGFERDISDSNSDLVAVNGVFVQNEWAYVVATYDGMTMAIYVDGLLQAATTSTISTPEVSLSTMIGAANGSPDDTPFHGNIDEYAIYDHALAVDRVSAHYAAAMQN